MSVETVRTIEREWTAQVAALLGAGDRSAEGDLLPLGWHFPLLPCCTPRDDLRADGFPGIGVPMAAHEFPRLLAGGRTVTFHRPLRIGETLTRRSAVIREDRKNTAKGAMMALTVRHTLAGPDAALALEEEQSFVLLGGRYRPIPDREPAPPGARLVQTITPDATMLFQFSALSFNSHRIHLDRTFAREVEGYPDLVVNGGLTTLLLCEAARSEGVGAIRSVAVRNKAPLFCDRPIGLWIEDRAGGARLYACDETGAVAAEMEITCDGI